MDDFRFQITVLGARGSMAISRKDCEIFGGATSCYMVQAGGETVFLDGGSGLLSAPVQLPKPPVILLSHLHLDHLLGLGMYPRMSQKGVETRVYLPEDGEKSLAEQLNGLYSPPYWPLSLANYAGDVSLLPLRFPLRIGALTVEGMEGNHPGGSLLFRLSCQGKSLVYATDYEHGEPSFSRLAAFAQDTDLLLYDGQYTREEYESRKGFGHSTAQMGMELMRRSGAKRLLLIHHDPRSTDEVLLERERRIGDPRIRYARAGEEFTL